MSGLKPDGPPWVAFGHCSRSSASPPDYPENLFFFLYIFRDFWIYCVPLPPLRGQHMVLCHPRWLPTSGLTEFAMCWGGAGFEPRTTDLQSGALPLSHLTSTTEPPHPENHLISVNSIQVVSLGFHANFEFLLRFIFRTVIAFYILCTVNILIIWQFGIIVLLLAFLYSDPGMYSRILIPKWVTESASSCQ